MGFKITVIRKGNFKMFIKKIKAKAVSGTHVLVNNLRRIFGRAPKMKFFYGSYYKHCDVIENRILFESFHGTTISDSPFYILKELLSRPDAGQYEIYYSSNTDDYQTHKKFIEANNIPVKLVCISSYEYLKILATAKYLINNSSFPVYFIKKDEQVYLQTWHGTPLKTLGKKMRKGIESMYNVQHNFLQATYLMHPNEFTKNAIMEDYNLNALYTGKVALSGYPRNSIFMDKQKAKDVRKKLGLEEKTVYAYMPTWRGTSNHSVKYNSYSREISDMMKYLDERMKDNQVLYVNFHPILKNAIQLGEYKHIKSFPAEVDKYEFLNCVDALVTDYSSVFFDFSVTRKPVILYMYDYDQYMQDRGMYMDIKDLPFVKLYDIESLTEWLSTEKILDAGYDDGDYCEKFIKYDSLDAPAKMLDLVLYGKEDGMVVEDYSENIQKPRRVIHPSKVTGRSDLEAVSKYAQKNDIVQFEKKWFKKNLSCILHDEYNESFDYVIITNTTPRTYLEEALVKFKYKPVIERLKERELKRTFPRLKVQPVYIRKFNAASEGCSVNNAEKKTIQAELISKDNKIYIDAEFKENGLIPVKFMLIDTNNNITCVRETTKEERQSGTICEDFIEWKEKIEPYGRYLMAAEAVESAFSSSYIVPFVNTEWGKQADSLIETFDKPEGYKAPCIVTEVGNPENKIGKKYEPGEMAILPYARMGSRNFGIYLCKPDKVVNEYTQARILKIRSKRSVSTVYLKMKKQEGLVIKDIVLRYRSAVSYDVPVDYTINESGRHYKIKAVIDFDKLPLRELYWDFRILAMKHGYENEIRARFTGNYWKYNFYLTNRQYSAGEGHMTFPYYTKGGCLAYLYRPDSPYDVYATKLKEMVASGMYILSKPFFKRRKVWLVYEKFCSMAQDNGYYFFKYCMEELSEEEKKDIYYVIDKNASDYDKIKTYDSHIIQFMSLKHILYVLGAVLYIASDSRTHLYAWRCKTSLIRSKIDKRPIFFLQHGVTALKQVAPLFGKHGSSPMTYFATTSQFEQDIVVRYLGYAQSKAPITGFTRWDVLEDTSTDDDRLILTMPTWRSWLEEVSDEEFLASDYYKNYSELIQSERLSKLLDDNNARMIFYIHPKFAGYIKNFKQTKDNIVIVPFGQEPLNEIMKRCHMLITDYSSVCWDVYYQKKPVIFYQFDYEKYDMAHGSYIDMETELFGRRAVTGDELLEELEKCIESGFELNQKETEDHHHYFEYIDDKNSERTYIYLKEKGY
jgi:CDP-glycerol glycerophosphotransferase (TagB/SpsB family)